MNKPSIINAINWTGKPQRKSLCEAQRDTDVEYYEPLIKEMHEALRVALSTIKSFRQTRYERGQEPEFTILKALAKVEGGE